MTLAATHPIGAFWGWWNSEGADTIERSIAAGDYAHVPALISARTSSIDPELEWELGVGESSRYCLTVTAGGLAALRPIAERWKKAAPASGAVWQFASARVPAADPLAKVFELDGHRLALADSRWSLRIDERRSCVDVGIWHPAFAALSPADRGTVGFLFLDWMLGEDGVERWVGDVDFDTVLIEGLPHTAVLEAVEAVTASAGGPTWVRLESRANPDRPVIATARRPLRWIDRPDFDQHNAVRMAFDGSTDEGLPGPAAAEWLRQFEDALLSTLGPRAMLLATETAEGQRTFYLHTDSEDVEATDLIARFAEANHGSAVQQLDPRWALLKRFS